MVLCVLWWQYECTCIHVVRLVGMVFLLALLSLQLAHADLARLRPRRSPRRQSLLRLKTKAISSALSSYISPAHCWHEDAPGKTPTEVWNTKLPSQSVARLVRQWERYRLSWFTSSRQSPLRMSSWPNAIFYMYLRTLTRGKLRVWQEKTSLVNIVFFFNSNFFHLKVKLSTLTNRQRKTGFFFTTYIFY